MMIGQIATVLCLAVCVLGDGHAISEQSIHMRNEHKEHSGHHGELVHIGSHEPEHHEEYAWAYPSYEFSYKVEDPHTHDMKGQHEMRHGDDVKGEYWLIEPDGRKRTVKYHSDKHSGFNAHVEYSAPHHHVYFKTKNEEHVPEVVEHHKPEIEYHKEEARIENYRQLPLMRPMHQKYIEDYHHPRFYRGLRQ